MKKLLTLAAICLIIPLEELRADITKDFIGKWQVTETWKQGKQKGTIKGQATVRRFQRTGFVAKSSARVKGQGLVKATQWFYPNGATESVTTLGGKTIALSTGTWGIQGRSVVTTEKVTNENGTYRSNGKVTLVNKNNLSGAYSTSWRVRGTTTFRRVGK